MTICACSTTVKQNWGSHKSASGVYLCGFCSKEQLESDVIKELGPDVTLESPREPEFPINWEKKTALEKALASGSDAALRVFRYGTLFEKIGSTLQWLNVSAAIIIIVVVLVVDSPASIKILGILFVGLIWALGFLQTSFVRGLASYFQMRSADYLERRQK